MKEKRTFTLKTLDYQVSHNYKVVRFFAPKYRKVIKKWEVHTPLAARIIVETENNIYHYLIVNALLKADGEGNINVWSVLDQKKTNFIENYYSDKELKEAKIMEKLFTSKSKFGISLDEITQRQKYQIIIAIAEVMTFKLSYAEGGGF